MNRIELPSVDIGIPALNEEANISRLLASVIRQKETCFNLKNIALVSDGSTDNTVKYAEELHIPKLKVIKHPKPRGPFYCWFELIQNSKADIVILFDADIELCHDDVINQLLQPMFSNKKITLTSGRPCKQMTSSFVDKIMNVSMDLQDYIKERDKHGTSVYGCHGRIVAVNRKTFRELNPIPDQLLGNDSFLYFYNKTHHGEFQYVPNATVAFKMPQTFQDFSRQERRFAQGQRNNAAQFGKWIYDEYRIPIYLKSQAILHSFKNSPFYTTCYLFFQLRSRAFGKRDINTKATWETPTSTKSLG